MQIINLTAYNNQDYILTLGMSAWVAAGFSLTAATLVKTARLPASTSAPALYFSSNPVAGQGAITVVPDVDNSGALTALRFDMAAALVSKRVPSPIAAPGLVLAYDVSYTGSDGATRLICGGTLTFLQGQSPA